MNKLFYIALIVCSISLGSVLADNCERIVQIKNIQAIPALNLEKYAGIWYEVRRNASVSVTRLGDCGRSNYTVFHVPASGVKRVNSQGLTVFVNNTVGIVNGSLSYAMPNIVNGNLKLKNNNTQLSTDYWVIELGMVGQQYNYSLVYSCQNDKNGQGQEFTWLYSRRQSIEPKDNFMKIVNATLEKYRFKPADLIVTTHTSRCQDIYNSASGISNVGFVLAFNSLLVFLITKLV